MASAGNGKRVLIVVQNLPVPFDRRVWLEATTLRSHGYTVSVICPKAKGFSAPYEVLEGVHIHRYALPFEARGALGFVGEFAWCFLATLFKSVKVAWRHGFDVIHACNPPDTYWVLGLLSRPFGKRFVFDHHDLSPEMYEAKFERPSRVVHAALRFLEWCSFRVADVAIATNESYKQVAVDRCSMPRDRIFTVRSGPDLGRLRRYAPDLALKARRDKLVVYLGEMCKQDGVEYLLRALEILRESGRGDDVFTVLVGGGPHQEEVGRYAGELGLGDATRFTGRVSDDELCRILSSADVAVDPDPKTPWSDKCTMNKIVEYMYFGLPIVCFDLTEHRVSAGDAALYVAPNQEQALADALRQLLDDPAMRERMSRIGRARVETKLAWQYSIPPLLEAYDRLWQTEATPLFQRAQLW
jgi:glycosyltransferase involved in cell wall biosynthesis